MSVFSSCQSAPEEVADPDNLCTITFSVNNYEQVSFDDVSASSSASGATRAVATDHPSTLAHLIVAVFDAESGKQACQPIQHDYKDYERNYNAYPKFSVTLPYGRYRLLVLGYNGSRQCNIASVTRISWEDDYVPNTFYYYEEFTLDQNTSLEQTLTLKHAVAAFRVEAEDAIPSELKKMRFSSTAGGTVLNPKTGFAVQNSGRTSEIIVPSDSIGKSNVMFTAYLFLPEEQINCSYNVQALGKNDAVLYGKTFSDVPLRIDYLTSWKGTFFETSEDVGFSFYWDTQWADTISIGQ
ncbi:MAG: hypothetical protein IKQ85_03775 [Bacteroidaceae bacterium]|nr:hypothetical protein [Bacteroidaceae bacterium]